MGVALQRALAVTLGVWAVGVQTHEAIATVGAWATFAIAARGLAPQGACPRSLFSSLRLFLPLALMLAWALIAPWLSGTPPTMTGVARLSDWLLLPAAAFAVAQVSDRALPRIGLIVAGTLLLSCLVAATQHFGLWPRSSAFASFSSLRLPFERMDETVPGRSDRFMAGGLLLHRLKFAHSGAALAVLLVAAAVFKPPYRRVFLVVALLAIPPLLIFPHARAAALALIAGAGVVVLLGVQNRRAALLVCAGFGVATLLGLGAVPSVRERFLAGLTSEGTSEREIITRAGLAAIRFHPFVGVGLGRFKPSLYAPPDAPPAVLEHQGKAHNQFVSLAAEVGVPAALALIAFLLSLAVKAWRARPSGVALLGVLTVFVLLCLLHDPLFHAESSLAFMLALGAGLGLIERRQAEASSTAAARSS